MVKTYIIGISIAVTAVIIGVVIIKTVHHDPYQSIGTAAKLLPPKGVTGLHGPNGEVCIKVLNIPGKKGPAVTTTTVVNSHLKYTSTWNPYIYKPGTKPVAITEHVCVYKPKAK